MEKIRYESIKKEFKQEGSKLMRLEKSWEIFEDLSRRAKKLELISKKLTNILNRLLDENSIEFENKKEEEEFVEYIRPIFDDLLIEFLKP